ncbi:MAG TPA: hypothetical protein VK923_12805 [Euzebyales bacterium]|nr:hypothetical protein [Euzebyales bacterium]
MLARLAPVVAAVVLLTLAVFGLAVITGIDRAQARLPRHEARVVVAYRFVVPLVAEAIPAVGAVAMIAGARLGVSSPAAFVVLMFVVGTENAWDLLLGIGRSPHDPHRQAHAHGYRCLARPVRQLRNGSFVRSRMDRVVRAA